MRRATVGSAVTVWLCLIAAGFAAPAPALAQAVGVKEVVIDSAADFKHTTASAIKLWKMNTRVDEGTGGPIGYFMDKSDLTDPNLILTSELETLITKITTQQEPTPNTYAPAEPGELRIAGWKPLTYHSDGQIKTDATVDKDPWNVWSAPAAALTAGPSLPVGGMNYILQSFKVYRTGLLDRLKIKIRCHPGVLKSDAPDLYVTILADDPAPPGGTLFTQPKSYASGGAINDVVLGNATLKASQLAEDSDALGTTAFQDVEVVFRGVERPLLLADKLYWMKISTIRYIRK